MTGHPRLDYDSLSDVELAAHVAERNFGAVRVVTQRNNQRLFRAALGILKNRDEAEDAVQTTYLRGFAAISDFRGEASLSTWLTRIAINVALGRLRTIRRNRAYREDKSIFFLEGYREKLHGSAAQSSPDECLSQAQLRRLLEAAIARLPSPFRMVFILRDIEGLSVAEVAETLAIAPGTVRTRHLRARLKLKQELEPEVVDTLTGAFVFAGADCGRMTTRVATAFCGVPHRWPAALGAGIVRQRASMLV